MSRNTEPPALPQPRPARKHDALIASGQGFGMPAEDPSSAQGTEPAREFRPSAGPLAAGNKGFHDAYERMVAQTLVELGGLTPVIILLGDDLWLLADGQRTAEEVIPEPYHQIKAFNHLAFGVLLTLMANGDGPISPATRTHLADWRTRAEAAEPTMHTIGEPVQPVVTAVLARARRIVEETLAGGDVPASRLRAHARALESLVFRSAVFAIHDELDRIHACIGRWRCQLGAPRWRRTCVVVCGRHQPRYRDAARQYFGRLFGEREGVGAEFENHVLYGEGVEDLDAALDLLARHRIDRRVSAMLFDDPTRFQRDLMADVAADHIGELLGQTSESSAQHHDH